MRLRSKITGLKRAPLSAGIVSLVMALAGCDDFTTAPPVAPTSRPHDTLPPAQRSAQSEALTRYYLALQNDLLTRGLLRTDGGGPDTVFRPDDLARNFETIAFFDEYSRGSSTPLSRPGTSGQLSRWTTPVRISTEFGASVPQAQRDKDQASVSGYAARLARITGHPVSSVNGTGNFHVFIAGEDDRDFVQMRLKQLVPNISQAELNLFANLPRSYYCLVVAVSDARAPHTYSRAVALIRTEHPDLVRRSCIHEEIAQGLGLPNDSPRARPSIFNDDDEFALLTTHDELLLKMLYDPRLKPGMTADQARPVVRIIAHEFMGQAL